MKGLLQGLGASDDSVCKRIGLLRMEDSIIWFRPDGFGWFMFVLVDSPVRL